MALHEQMQNLGIGQAESGGCRPERTGELTRGVCRLFRDMGLASVVEFRLPNGRRADVAGIDAKGRFVIAEVKSCEADYAADNKWRDYLGFCDRFYFAVDMSFPAQLLPVEAGLIVADAYGGEIMRDAIERALAPARRKALTLKFARQAAARAALALDDIR